MRTHGGGAPECTAVDGGAVLVPCPAATGVFYVSAAPEARDCPHKHTRAEAGQSRGAHGHTQATLEARSDTRVMTSSGRVHVCFVRCTEVTLPIQTEHEGWDLEILHAFGRNKTNVHTARTLVNVMTRVSLLASSVACVCP